MYEPGQFEWKDFYAELAEKLGAYRNDRKSLVSKVNSIVEESMGSGIKMPDFENVEDGELTDIDPFTVFALFNRRLDKRNRKRAEIAKNIKREFSIVARFPMSFSGVPVIVSSPIFYKSDEDIEKLWELFDVALRYGEAVSEKTGDGLVGVGGFETLRGRDDMDSDDGIWDEFVYLFDYAQRINGNGVTKVTMGLYWIAPEVFLSLDGKNIEFIFDSGELPQDVVNSLPKIKSRRLIDAGEYLSLIATVRGYITGNENTEIWKNFMNLSYEAYEYSYRNKGKKKKDDNNGCERVTGGDNVIYYGVPGAGKSYAVGQRIISETGEQNYSKMERVVFHPDYTYSDFVGQIMPKLHGDKLIYKFIPGPFSRILREAVNDPYERYYLVIEEINRGNAPAIFGDLLQLLDRDDAGESRYSITDGDIDEYLNNDDDGKRVSDFEVRIPANLSILATMNSSDQNVFTLDTAFQRRWGMNLIINDVMNATCSNEPIEGSGIVWGVFASVVNSQFLTVNKDMLSSEDKRLGAYFVKNGDELSKDKFPEKVIKYLWDDAFRGTREMLFDERFSSLEEVIATYKEAVDSNDDPLRAVLYADVYDMMTSEMEKKRAGENTSGDGRQD